VRKPLIILGVSACLGLIALFALPFFWSGGFCYTPPKQNPVAGSQGYRVWFGDTLKSFEHKDARVCVPRGWQAVGAIETGDSWAKFESGMTGVLIRSDAFASTLIEPGHSSYSVTVFYATSTDAELLKRYEEVIENAFDRTGRLFNDAPGDPRRPHAVLITAGIAGDTRSPSARVYPDPHAGLSVFMRTPENPRAEELFIHAVLHLYNRHRTDLIAHENAQSPFAPEDWQELEATWGETAFSTGNRLTRLTYLYNVHTAVRTGDFSLITSPPFNDEEGFKKIRASAVVAPGSAPLDYQYGHYVLAPLSMLAVEGLLQELDAGTDVEETLRGIHSGEAGNFFEELAKRLPEKEMARVRGWFEGTETVPSELVHAAVRHYEAR